LDSIEKHKLIRAAWMRFNSNIGSLYSLFENLNPSADQLDKAQIQKLIQELAFVFKDNPEAIEKDISKYIPSIDDLDMIPNFAKSASVKEMVTSFHDPEIRDTLLQWEQKKPYRAIRLVRAFSAAFNQPPTSGILIRRSMLISMITFLEIAIRDMHKSFHLIHGKEKSEAKRASDKALKGKSWRDKIYSLRDIGLDIPANSKYTDELFEYTQRRHSLVHNDGVVDEGYEKNIPGKYELGDHLLVSTRYFQRAIGIVHTLVFLLFYNQFCQNEGEEISHRFLDDFMLNCFDQKRYSLILELSENFESLHLPEHKGQISLANRAIAFRELGQSTKVGEIVSSLMTMEHDWQIDLAISMLKNDMPTLRRLIEKAPNAPNIAKISSWPLFDPVRNEVWFKTVFVKKNKVQLRKKFRR
jgi:hypothetical protein